MLHDTKWVICHNQIRLLRYTMNEVCVYDGEYVDGRFSGAGVYGKFLFAIYTNHSLVYEHIAEISLKFCLSTCRGITWKVRW